MKKRVKHVTLIVLAAFCCISAVADNKKVNTKFGKPTKQELEMTIYEPDPEAEAVILSKLGEAIYTYDTNDGFKITYKYETRIKILKQEGTGYANVEIPYYYVENSSLMHDDVAAIKGYSFNLENGKTVKTELKKEMIFDEQVYDNYHVVKFSIPNVKVGSVVEYKYEIRSTRISYMRTWHAQYEIPIMYSYFETTIPKYFRFNAIKRGYGDVRVSRDFVTSRFDISVGIIREAAEIGSERIEVEANALPAMREDEFTFGVGDYIAHVDFEMQGLSMPGKPDKSYSTTWDAVDKALLDGSLGKVYNMKNPYPQINEVTAKIDDVDGKVAIIRSYVASQMKWNNCYGMYSPNANDEIRSGSATNCTINGAIMSMMRDAGVECYAVVLRLRRNGALLKFLPSLDNLDTFVIAYRDSKGDMRFLDGSNPNNDIDVLPVQMLVENARIVARDYNGEKWLTFSKLGKNVSQTSAEVALDVENGTLNCKEQQKLRGQIASSFRRGYADAADSAAYVDGLASKRDITINDMQIRGLQVQGGQISLISDYDKAIDVTDSLIYLCPTVMPLLDANPFTEVKRELPVSFPFCKEQISSVTITIPEGYVVEELPESVALQSEGREMQYVCQISLLGNSINVMSKFALKETLFPLEKYDMLRNFYTYVADKCNEMIVLRKQ